MASEISIDQDKIMLHWDGELPPNAPDSAIHDVPDVIYFWEHLRGHIKWSKRGYFYMPFGKQNLKRLHSQFGQIKVRFGKSKIETLKKSQVDLYDCAKKMEAAKNLPIEQLPVYDYKKPPLGPYQHRGVVILVNVPKVALFADCGLGKTYMVLTSTEQMIKKGVIEPGDTLVVGKLLTLDTGWLQDAKSFTDLNAKILWSGDTYKRQDKVRELIKQPADIYITNHDGLRIYEEELAAKNFKRIILDESTIIKGFHGMHRAIRGGQVGRSLNRVAHSAEWKAIMSGTPAPNGPGELWGQFYFLDNEGLILEPSFNDFKEVYYQTIDLRKPKFKYIIDRKTSRFVLDDKGKPIVKPLGPKDPRKEVPKKGAIDKVADLTDPLTYRLRARDHLDLPPIITMVREVEMTTEQRKHYTTMENELKVVINDERITAAIKLTQTMKCRQITGGFIIDHKQTPHEIPKTLKFEMLDSLVEDEISFDQKIIICAEFRWEIEEIVKRYKKYNPLTAYGGHSPAESIENIKKFKTSNKHRLFVMNPRSAAHGITLTEACYMIFYSYSHSFEMNYQAIKRIERASQKQPMFVYYLACKRSIDKDIYDCIIGKEQGQQHLIDRDLLKRLSR